MILGASSVIVKTSSSTLPGTWSIVSRTDSSREHHFLLSLNIQYIGDPGSYSKIIQENYRYLVRVST